MRFLKFGGLGICLLALSLFFVNCVHNPDDPDARFPLDIWLLMASLISGAGGITAVVVGMVEIKK